MTLTIDFFHCLTDTTVTDSSERPCKTDAFTIRLQVSLFGAGFETGVGLDTQLVVLHLLQEFSLALGTLRLSLRHVGFAPDLVIGELLVVLHAAWHTLNLLRLLVKLEVAPRILLVCHTTEEDFLFVAPPKHVIERVHTNLLDIEPTVPALSEDDITLAALLIHILHLLILTLIILIRA